MPNLKLTDDEVKVILDALSEYNESDGDDREDHHIAERLEERVGTIYVNECCYDDTRENFCRGC